jgi:DNA modification methylase
MVILSGIFSDTPINTQEIPQKLLDIQDKHRSNPLPWKGQFSPQLIETLIKKYADKNSIIFDPFLGSGTVLYEAARFGIEAHGTDINPAALTLASIYKFTNISQRQREVYTSKFIKQLSAGIPDDTMPLFQSTNLQKDLAPDEIKQKLVKLVENTEENLIKLLYEILIILLDFGNTELTSFRIFTLANTISSFIHKLPCIEKTVNTYNVDSRNTPLTDGKINLVITSPPYINVFNYHQQYRASTEALGWNLLEVAKSEFGSNRKHRSNRFLTVIQYCLDIAATLQELLRICSADSRMIFIVGRESNVRGTAFYNGEIVTEIAHQVFGMDLHTRQERKFTNRYGQIIIEDILHFKKQEKLEYNNLNTEIPRIIAIKSLEAAYPLAANDVKSDIKDAITKANKVEPSPYYNPEKARK